MVHAFALPGLQAEFAAGWQRTVSRAPCTCRALLFAGVWESSILQCLFSSLLLPPSRSLSHVLLLPPKACMAHAGQML